MSPKEMRLQGRRIVITGAGGGIGVAATTALQKEGAVVAGIDSRSIDGLIEADIRDAAQVTAAIKEVARTLRGIDILINNAGVGHAHDAGDFPNETARAVMEVNFFGAWNTTAAALPFLLESKGHVINVSSGLAKVDLPYAVAYSASKRALAAYSAALAIEYDGRLSVTTIYPGYIKTSIHDSAKASGVGLEGLIRPDTLEGAAAAIVRACARRPRSLTTSPRSTVELWAAGRFPRSTERVMSLRMKRWTRSVPTPPFLRYPDERFAPKT